MAVIDVLVTWLALRPRLRAEHRPHTGRAVALGALLLVGLTGTSPGRALAAPAAAPAAPTPEAWPTYLHDNQRTSANLTDTALSTANAARLVKKWAFATGGPIASGVTVVGTTLYFGSWDGYEYAVDAATKALKWKTYLGITVADPICSPPKAGVSSTATVYNGVLYVGGGDANWHALDANTGAELWSVPTGDNSPEAGHYNWSSPLIYNGYAYIGVASVGDCPLVQGQLLQVSLATHEVVHKLNLVPNGMVGAGVWSSPSVDPATNTVFVTTGTLNDPSQIYAEAIIALDATSLAVKSYWDSPRSTILDSDWSTSPILFTDQKGRKLIAGTNKNGYVYAFNRKNLAAGPVWKQKIAAGGKCPLCGDGSVASAAFARGTLFIAGGNSVIRGRGSPGYVRALDPATGKFKWEHRPSGSVLPAVAWVNGLIVDGAGSTIEVLNAATGARLYSYTTGGPFYGPASIVNGTIYEGSTDGKLYAFGLPGDPPGKPHAGPNCPAGWTCRDVGGPVPAGANKLAGKSWTLHAGGSGLLGAADQFRLVSQRIAGDAQAIARIASLRSPAGKGQTGLLFRQSDDPGSPSYEVVMRPGGAVSVAYRSMFGEPAIILNTLGGVKLPAYLEIQRHGDRFSAASSTDGIRFQLVPGSTVTMPLPDTVLAGLAFSSGANGTGATASIDSVRLGRPTNQPLPVASAHPCPTGWSCTDIGNPLLAGDQSQRNGTWTIKGGGDDIYYSADQLHYVWKTLAGDGSVGARVIAQTQTDGYAKAGVMLRQSAEPDSAEYSALVTPSNGMFVEYRGGTGQSTILVLNEPATLPAFIKVARSQGYFSTYTSQDGLNWSYLPGSTVHLDLPGAFLGGVAVTSHNVIGLGTVILDHVSVSATAPPSPTACPRGWSCADIGSPFPSGAQAFRNGTWTIYGGGADIGNISDEFHMVGQPLAGDGTFSARVVSQTPTDPWAKAGVMLRQSAEPNAPQYSALITPKNGIVIQYRSITGGVTNEPVITPGAAPKYLRVSRSKGVFTTYTSIDGKTWTPVAGSSVAMNWKGGALAGMAVTSHNTIQAGTVVFDSVQLANLR